MQKSEHSSERRGRGSRPPFRHKRSRHPGLAERDLPLEPPKPQGELPEAFANNVFGTLNPLLQHAVAEEGYLEPTPIQAQSIPPLLEGRDILGCAQTGTGKTAAFLLPILHRIAAAELKPESGRPRALVLAPTRELAAQIANCAAAYGKFLGIPFAVVFGGVGQFPQVKALKRGAILVIATPGRLFDLMDQGHVTLDNVTEFVLDEADRMLDMGFLPDIKEIIKHLPEERHTQFFSATLSKDILKLAHTMVNDPVEITISPDEPTVDRINQLLMFVEKGDKEALLANLLQEHPEYEKVLVFARTRHGADKIVRALHGEDISAEAIHSDKSQRMRTNALNAFRNGKVRVLIATDIASRGIDVDNITHVINYDLPEETESYVHRIGRTARAGASGAAISFVSAEERGLLRAIERMIKRDIEICRDQPFHSEKAERAAGKARDENGDPVPAWRKRRERPERRPSRRPDRGQTDYRRRREEREENEERPARRERKPHEERFARHDRDEYASRTPREEGRPARSEKPPRRREYDEDDGYRPAWEEEPHSERRRSGSREKYGERHFGSKKRDHRGDTSFEERPVRGKKEPEESGSHWYDLPFGKKGRRHEESGASEFEERFSRYTREAGDEEDFSSRKRRDHGERSRFEKSSSPSFRGSFAQKRGNRGERSGSFDRFKPPRGSSSRGGSRGPRFGNPRFNSGHSRPNRHH